MNWPWVWLRHRHDGDQVSDDAQEAVEATRSSEVALQRVRDQRGEVQALADRLREHRASNHFAELFTESLRRSR